MSDEIYGQLADALDRLPNAFPRTPSNVETQLLKKIFTPEVTGCPDNVAVLQRKSDNEIIHPPANYAAWEQERMDNRGLSK